jgi:hypothetical protein
VIGAVGGVVGGVTGGGGDSGGSGGGSGSGSGSGSGGGDSGGSGGGGSGDGGSGDAAGSGGGAGAAAGAGASGSGPGATSRPPRRVRASQPVVRNTGDRRQRRAAVITFRLQRAAIVRFRIRQEAPRCLVIGSFTVRGEAGRNRVRFTGSYRGVTLPPGTYTLTGHAFRNGRVTPLGAATVVITGAGQAAEQPTTCNGPADGVDANAAAALLASARGNAGGTDGESSAQDGDGTQGVAGSEETNGVSEDDSDDESREAASAGAGGGGGDDEGDSRPILGVPNPFDEAPTWVQPLLLIALASAIVLLLLAAIPATAVRPVNAAPTVVRRRSEFALAGAMILGAVAIAALVV